MSLEEAVNVCHKCNVECLKLSYNIGKRDEKNRILILLKEFRNTRKEKEGLYSMWNCLIDDIKDIINGKKELGVKP